MDPGEGPALQGHRLAHCTRGASEPREPVPWGSAKEAPIVKGDKIHFLNLGAELVFS